MLRITHPDGSSLGIQPGETAAGLVEACTYRLRLLDGEQALLVDDIPLEPLGDGDYSWQPAFYAGTVRVEVCDKKRKTAATYFLDVGPTDHKLGVAVFEKMVEELYALRPELLLGTEAATRGVGYEGNYWNPELGYSRLRQHGESCVTALRAICKDPLLRLKHERRSVLPHQARRIDITTVRDLARGPGIA